MNLLPFLVSGLGIGAVYALSGVGLVVLYRASGVLNFAFGALGALGAYCAWSLLDADWPPVVAWLAAIAAAALGSLAYGQFIAPRLAHRDRVVRAVGTLGFALVLLGLTMWLWGENPRRLGLPSDRSYWTVFDVRVTYTRGIALGLAALMVAAIGLLLARTRLGLAMRALANSRDLSALLGIRVLRVDTIAWVISGVFAGICGLLLANLVRLQAMQLTFLVIPAIAAAIIGRLNSLWQTAVAGIAIGVLESAATVLPVVAPYRTAVPFLVALLAMLVLAGRARDVASS
jgi:branched-chain amino acid transport system permease protein